MNRNPINWIQDFWMGLVVFGFMIGCLILDRSDLYLSDKSLPLTRGSESQ